MLASELITELSDLTALHDQWDKLAIQSELPLMAPASVIAWWRHLAPAGAKPRVILAKDGDELIGITPFYVDLAERRGRLDLRLPGIELTARLAPLAAAGREREVARTFDRSLRELEPRPDLIALEGMPLTATWAASLREGWYGRGRPISCRYNVLGSPTVSLEKESFDAWFADKSSNFRSQMRRLRRAFASLDGTSRTSSADTLRQDVDTFVRLHTLRWAGRGRSNLLSLGSALPALLNELGQRLISNPGRFRLQLLEIDGEAISAQLFLGAGGRVLYVNGGWDDNYVRLKPPMLAILFAIEEAFGHGDRRVDLGAGVQPYKLRFADGSDPIAWSVLVPFGARLPFTCLSVGPMIGRVALRNAIKGRVSQEQLDYYRRFRTRLGNL